MDNNNKVGKLFQNKDCNYDEKIAEFRKAGEETLEKIINEGSGGLICIIL